MFNDNKNKDIEAMFAAFSPSPQPQDPDYLYRRAEQELELAQIATHPAVVKAHCQLADHYLESLYAEGDAAIETGAGVEVDA